MSTLQRYSGLAKFAREIFGQAGHAVTVIEITTARPREARPPSRQERLDCRTTESTLEGARADWHRGLAEVLNDLGDQT